MPFDGGFSGGASQVTALQDFNAHPVTTFGWSSAQAYARGHLSMNGRSDTLVSTSTSRTSRRC